MDIPVRPLKAATNRKMDIPARLSKAANKRKMDIPVRPLKPANKRKMDIPVRLPKPATNRKMDIPVRLHKAATNLHLYRRPVILTANHKPCFQTQPIPRMPQTLTKPETQPAPEPTHGLPSPREYPNADVLIYDGNCNFCLGQVKNVRRLDGKNRVAFISLHDSFVAEHFPDLTYDQLMEQMFLIPATNKPEHPYGDARHGGAAAIRYLTRRLPLLWIFTPLLHFPFSLPVWQWGYGIVARRRYKIAGKRGVECDENGSCELHFGNKK